MKKERGDLKHEIRQGKRLDYYKLAKFFLLFSLNQRSPRFSSPTFFWLCCHYGEGRTVIRLDGPLSVRQENWIRNPSVPIKATVVFDYSVIVSLANYGPLFSSFILLFYLSM